MCTNTAAFGARLLLILREDGLWRPAHTSLVRPPRDAPPTGSRRLFWDVQGKNDGSCGAIR